MASPEIRIAGVTLLLKGLPVATSAEAATLANTNSSDRFICVSSVWPAPAKSNLRNGKHRISFLKRNARWRVKTAKDEI
jgi:hypothetical protein